MIQEIDILFHLIHFINILLIKCDQRIHGSVEILTGKGCHTVNLFDDLNHCRGGIKYNFIPDIFELEAVAVANLLIITRYTDIREFYQKSCEREQHDHLCDLDTCMSICHETSRIVP